MTVIIVCLQILKLIIYYWAMNLAFSNQNQQGATFCKLLLQYSTRFQWWQELLAVNRGWPWFFSWYIGSNCWSAGGARWSVTWSSEKSVVQLGTLLLVLFHANVAKLAQLFFDWTPVGSFWHTLWLNNDKQQGNTVLGCSQPSHTSTHTYTVHTVHCT